MSPPICLIERSGQGDAIERVRLTAERLDESWAPEEAMPASERPVAAARWVSQIVTNHTERALSLVCLDTSGSFASWVRPTTRDARVVETMIRQSDGEALVGVAADLGGYEESAHASEGLVGPDLASPGGGAFQVLLDDDQGLMTRAAVLAVRDPAASLFLDELDALGVRVHAVDSLWHLIAQAWDPATTLREHAESGEMIVASDAPLSAVCIIDAHGRLVWSWSRAGRLVAAGQIRVPARDGAPHLRPGSLARLGADWVAWSSQLGAAPQRVVFIAPRSGEGEPELTPQQIGEGLSRALPQASIDLALVDDPLGETCQRVAGYRGEAVGPPADPTRSLVALANRPGRFRTEQMRVFNTVINQPASGQRAIELLEQEVERAETELTEGRDLPAPHPILQELDTLLLVLGMFYDRGLQLEQIDLGGFTQGRVVVTVEQTSVYEELIASLNSMNSAINWGVTNTRTRGNRTEVTLTGAWR